MIMDRRYRTVAYAVFGLIFNLLYAFYNGAFGIRNHSIWFGASCVYYLVLATMRFLVVTGNQTTNVKKEYAVMRFTGVWFCVLSIVLSVIIYISLTQNVATKYGEITMLTIATYTFTKITMAIVKTAKYRKKNSPLMRVIQNIRYAEITVSIFTMQCSMLVSFGDMEAKRALIFNMCTGSAVCLFAFGLGIVMMIESKKGERKYGEVKVSKGK
ncbi:MAG: hypothetical protein UHS49_06875 [Faecalimonas sp.]|nr:hypothetical protein [Faecalimonas sp.]